ncbi:MAG: MMPL family transporter [Planctomycetaceae bacterium]|nr:MMPL family transporter [Planctomycetaceae bacterium]
MRPGWGRPALGLVLLLLVGAYAAQNFRVQSDITHFLPAGQADRDVELARSLAFGELSRTMVLLVSSDAHADAPEISVAFESELRTEPALAAEIDFLEGGPEAGVEEDLWRLYEPRRFGFLAAGPEAAAKRTTDEGLARAADDIVAQLASPLSSLVSKVAPADPFLVLPHLLERLETARGSGLAVERGRFVADGGQTAVLLLGTQSPSSDNRAQGPILEAVRAAFARLDTRFGGSLSLTMGGANRYGLAMERDIRADIQRVTFGSAIALSLGFWLLFRSLRLFVLVLPVLAAGFAAGTATCLALFGSVHAMTLAFGAALIGVSVDYAVHFHVHQSVAPDPRGPRATLAGIWPGLALSAATTVLAFLALAVSSFPGLRELAVFAASGIAAALLATTLFLPSLESPHGRAGAAARLAAWLERRFVGPSARALRTPARVVLGSAALLVLLGLPRARFEDGVASLNRLDPELLAEDKAVHERVTRFEQRRIAVALGADDERALRVNDRVGDQLAAAERDGQLEGYWSAALFLPSAERQLAVDAVLRDDPSLWPRTEVALERAGLVVDGFGPFREALAGPAPAPLVPADLKGSKLAGLVRPLRLEVGDQVAWVSYLRGVAPGVDLGPVVEAVGGRLLDVEAELSSAYGQYRERMVRLCLVGLALVILLVFARHRMGASSGPAGVRRTTAAIFATLAACVPALLGAACTAALLGLLDRPLNLLSLVALLMVVSMGVDYGVLAVEVGRRGGELGTTLLSVLVAACSTAFGFLLLALSEQTALSSIGTTAGVGVLLCLSFVVLLPLAWGRGREVRT